MKIPDQVEFFIASFGLLGGMITMIQKARKKRLIYIEMIAIMLTAVFVATITDMLIMSSYPDNVRIGVAALVGYTSEQTLEIMSSYWLLTIEKLSSLKISFKKDDDDEGKK